MKEDKQVEKKLNRRSFLKVTGGAAATVAAVSGGMSLLPFGANAASDALPRKWDETYDVIVIGSGFAGLAAAIEAKNGGAKDVVVFEKMPVHGGNSIINGGDFCAPGTKLQKEKGIEDSAELMLKDMLRAGLYLNHPEIAKAVAYGANDALEWTESYLGVKYVKLGFHGGHSVQRAHGMLNQTGAELVNKQLAKVRELGVKIQMRTKLVKFLANKDGRIVGMEVLKGYKFPDEKSGKTAFIKARKAVVLSSGGFSQDAKLRQIQDPRLTDQFGSTNHPGATGEALLAACTMGAMDVQMDWIQLGPWTSPDEKGFGYVPLFCEPLVGYGLMINPKTGKRFFKETGNRKERADAIILAGNPVLIMGDSYAVNKRVVPRALKGGMEIEAIKKFDTLEDIAKAYDMPQDVFLKEVARWNAFVEKRQDDDFGCMIFKDTQTTATAPFYVARLWPKVHHTMGGLVIDQNAQVMGFDFKPVKGLFAAGEVTGGVHGAVRLGGVAIADCLVFGRIAGKNAAREKAWG